GGVLCDGGRTSDTSQPPWLIHGVECTRHPSRHRPSFCRPVTYGMPPSHGTTWFDLSADQRAVLGPVREVLTQKVAPGATERDAAGTFPHQMVAELAQLGLFGLQVPERYGGSGLDTTTATLIIEEVAAVDGSLALTVALHNSLCFGHLLHAADERQRDEWLPPLARGEVLGAWCLTEPVAGCDAAVLTTRATQKGSGWSLTGSKIFITQR